MKKKAERLKNLKMHLFSSGPLTLRRTEHIAVFTHDYIDISWPISRIFPFIATRCSFVSRLFTESYFWSMCVHVKSCKLFSGFYKELSLKDPLKWFIIDFDKLKLKKAIYQIILMNLKSGSKQIRHIQNLTIFKKSTLLVLSSLNLVKMINTWSNFFHKISWG